MIHLVRLIPAALTIAVVLLTAQSSQGNTFNWPTSPAFPAGPTGGNSLLQLYGGLGAVTLTNNVDPGTGTGGTWGSGFPVVNNTTTTGGAAGNPNGLQLNITNQPTTVSNIKFALAFGYNGGATGVSFTIWDVDSDGSTWTDKIANIVGITPTGTQVTATVTNVGGATNTITGSGTLTSTATGTSTNTNTSNKGNVTIAFGATAIQSVEFIWTDSLATSRQNQFIGISPITFTPVGSATPEVGTSFAALAVCVGVIGYGGMFRRRRSTVRS